MTHRGSYEIADLLRLREHAFAVRTSDNFLVSPRRLQRPQSQGTLAAGEMIAVQ
jgi:hypothetical protein